MNIKDQRFSAQIEAFLSGKDALSFVAQNEEDREAFLREVGTIGFGNLLLISVLLCIVGRDLICRDIH